jgi:hypothetical protein
VLVVFHDGVSLAALEAESAFLQDSARRRVPIDDRRLKAPEVEGIEDMGDHRRQG